MGRISSASLNVIDLSTHVATLHGAFPGLCARAALVAICFPRPTIPKFSDSEGLTRLRVHTPQFSNNTHSIKQSRAD